ncbi:cation channel sperm-associated protein subunit delta-domain-containing protein [Polychytrium aggregatum]|uniref:cation channel sperm-associated protein subunit delta-domain-containing protein n=1 Tax=Polychytrium aggregatum TaxID=110093 RepID=UPI0022FE2801|nr:cation channel sperm-associated protein subunit delta-domain-containing protein [Polychytrium aggregatum]KAI9199815.1 cation channel sperm-associated protein subunit delta-domain-containing protein [Polychytrium aggregatum]
MVSIKCLYTIHALLLLLWITPTQSLSVSAASFPYLNAAYLANFGRGRLYFMGLSMNPQSIQINQQSGVQGFQVYRDGNPSTTDTYFVYLSQPQTCYRWYMASGSITGQTASNAVAPYTSNLTAYIWLIDEASATASELAGTAATPGSALGDSPIISFPSSRSVAINSLTYDKSNIYWALSYNASSAGLIPMLLASAGVAVLNCLVAQTPVYLNVLQYSNAGSGQAQLPATISPSNTVGPFWLSVDPCNQNVVLSQAYSISNATFLMSQLPLFGSLSASNIQPTGLAGTILMMVSNSAGVAALTTSGLYFSQNAISFVAAQGGLPASPYSLNSLRQPTWCNYYSVSVSLNAVVIAWQKTQGSGVIFISTNGGQTYQALDLSSQITASAASVGSGFVRDVSVDHIRSRLSALIRRSDGRDQIIIIDMANSLAVSLGYLFASLDADSPILDAGAKVRFGLESRASCNNFAVDPDGGTSVVQFQLFSRDPTTTATGLMATEYVSQVVSNADGLIAAMTSSNRLFLGKLGLSQLYEIASGVLSTDATSSIAVDVYGRLQVVSPSGTVPGSINVRYVPVPSEIESLSAISSLACNYQSWSANISGNYILDVHDVLPYQIALTPNPGSKGAVFFSTTSQSLINLTTLPAQETVSYSFGALATTNVLYQGSISPQSYQSPGNTLLKIQPTSIALGCATTQKTVSFNCSLYGPPIPAYYAYNFVPIFDVYDGSVLQETLQANFVLWEDNGRTTFSFNTTVGQSYQSCFVTNPNAQSFSASSVYQILNYSSYSAITWSSGNDGIYMFSAKVIDPSYSYCLLTTKFAVSVYGSPISVGAQTAIVFGMCAGILLILFISYFVYWSKNEKERKEQEERERLEEEAEKREEEELLLKDAKKWDAIPEESG